MLLDVPHAIMGEVSNQHLPPQVQDLIHHMPKPMEQIPLVLLQEIKDMRKLALLKQHHLKSTTESRFWSKVQIREVQH